MARKRDGLEHPHDAFWTPYILATVESQQQNRSQHLSAYAGAVLPHAHAIAPAEQHPPHTVPMLTPYFIPAIRPQHSKMHPATACLHHTSHQPQGRVLTPCFIPALCNQPLNAYTGARLRASHASTPAQRRLPPHSAYAHAILHTSHMLTTVKTALSHEVPVPTPYITPGHEGNAHRNVDSLNCLR